MERKIDTKAFLRAALIFFGMFLLIFVSIFVKYRAYGSFTDGGNKSTLYVACAGSGISILLLLL